MVLHQLENMLLLDHLHRESLIGINSPLMILQLKQLASQMCRGAPWRKTLLTLNTLSEQIDLLKSVQDGAFVQPSRIYEDDTPNLEINCQ